MNIPLGKPFLGDEEKKAVARVISSRHIATGETVKELETALATKFQRKYGVAVSSGTAALYLGLKALGTKCVIVPTLTCYAVLHAVLNAGAKVIFADIEPETHNLDLSTLSKEQLSRAEAVVITHTYGHAVDMDKLDYYIKRYNLTLVEDFAQATGGYFRNRILGSFGKVAVTSFYGAKVIATGHGGAILTDDEELYHRCIYGRGSRVTDYYEGLIPMNLQMTDIQAAVGLIQLNKLDIMTEMRQKVARKYNQELGASPAGLLRKQDWAKHAYYKYAVVLPEGIEKQAFMAKMGESGIEIGKLYDPPLHQTKLAQDVIGNKERLPVAEYLAPRTVSLPMFPELSSQDVTRVCEVVRSVINNLGDQTS